MRTTHNFQSSSIPYENFRRPTDFRWNSKWNQRGGRKKEKKLNIYICMIKSNYELKGQSSSFPSHTIGMFNSLFYTIVDIWKIIKNLKSTWLAEERVREGEREKLWRKGILFFLFASRRSFFHVKWMFSSVL